jgi:hypothetical protein
MRIYLDVCCLCRPLDDQNIHRVLMETDALRMILLQFEQGNWVWVSSFVVKDEIDRTRDDDRRKAITNLTAYIGETIYLQIEDLPRLERLRDLGFRLFDAMHILCAEKGRVDALLTTDDKMIRLATRVSEQLDVRVVNPVDWLREEAKI